MFICKLDKNDWGYAISVFLVPLRNEWKITVALDHPVVRHSGLVFTSIMSHVWPPPALDGCLERAKMASHHDPICVTSVWVRLIPKVSITVVVTAKRMTKEAKKWGKMAILWLSERHNNSLMALKLFSHQYLLAPMIWCDFYHFWIPGSIICWQLFRSFTDVMKGASPSIISNVKIFFCHISFMICSQIAIFIFHT